MKKIQLKSTKLKLNKETITSLTNEETKAINGGDGPVSADPNRYYTTKFLIDCLL